MSIDTSTLPRLHPHTTLHCPTPLTKCWSSQPHPDPSTPLLATASSDKSVNIWDMRDWRLISTVSGGHKRSIRCVGWKDYGTHRRKKSKTASADSTEEPKRDPVVLATGSFDANTGLWVWNRDYRSSKQEKLASGMPGSFDDDEQEHDFTTNNDDEEEEWHFSTLLQGPDSEIKDVQFSPAHYGANLLATCSRDKSVWVWEEVESEEWETIAVLGEHQGDVKCVRWLGGVRTSQSQLRRRLQNRKQKQNTQNSDLVTADEDDEIILASRELLATSSYDDTIRLHHDDEAEGDWMCIACMTAHDGTVWDLKFEPYINVTTYPETTTPEEIIIDWSPRLLSCSDDMTIRLWQKELRSDEREKRNAALSAARQGSQQDQKQSEQRQMGFAGSKLPSSIRVGTSNETWSEIARLPQLHVRSVYSIDWSARTGLIVSCGGDGIIAVYREVPAGDIDTQMSGTHEEVDGEIEKAKMEWKVVALFEDAHGEYEINHVCWAGVRDQRKRNGDASVQDREEEEYIVSTGDDGDVRVWRLPEELLKTLDFV